MKISSGLSSCLSLVFLLLASCYVAIGVNADTIKHRSHFFHGTSHSYKHGDLGSFGTKPKIHLHPYKIALADQFISKYEYELEFKGNIAMIQLDHETFSNNIKYIECFDAEMKDIEICFNSFLMLSEFVRDLKIENKASNNSFVIASSDQNQWRNCYENIKEISLLRMLDLNHCLSDYNSHCLQCTGIKTVNHDNIIQNGYITFHTNLTKQRNQPEDTIPVQIPHHNPGRNLLQSTITYQLSVETCAYGATEDKIWIIVEGDAGVTSPVYSLGYMTSSGSVYSLSWEGIDVGTIRKMYFVNYGSDDFKVYNIEINGVTAGVGWAWAFCATATYSGSSADGCGVATIDFGLDDYDTTQESPVCITRAPDVKTPTPIYVQTPAPINPSGRTYSIVIQVVYGFATLGSEDVISFIIIGESGTTSTFTATLPTVASHTITHFDEVDVGIITNIHMVMFGADDVCFDRLEIDGTYVQDSTCLLCSSHCIGYNSWQESGCNVIDIDFVAGQVYDSEEIPCSTLTASGNIIQDSWVVNGLLDVLESVVGGDKTGQTSYTGTEQITKSLTSIDRTFTLQFDQLPSVTIDGNISVDSNLRLELEFVEGAVTSYFVGLSYDAGIELIMSLIVDTEVANIDKSLFSTEFPTFGIDVGFFSFGIFVGMDLHGSLSAQVNANYVCTFSYNVFGDIGLQLTAQNGWVPSSEINKDFQFECSSLSASAAATISVYPIFFVRVDYVLDNKNIIVATAKPFVEASVEFDSNSTDGCYLGISANFGMQIVVTSQIVDNSWTLFNDKWPVFSGCLDHLLTISIAELRSIAQNAILYIANGQNLCSTSYSTTNRKNSMVSLANICSQSDLESRNDETNNTKTSHMFGVVNTVWNGRLYPLSTFTATDPQTQALKKLNYETYQTVSINEEANSVDIAVLYKTVIADYGSSGLPLTCFYTLLQTVNDTSLKTGISEGIVDRECIHGQNVTSDEGYGGIYWWVYNFKQMKVRIAKRLFFAEFLITKTFQTNVDFADLAFSASDNDQTFYGGVLCNVCENNSSCDAKIKSFELTLYSNGKKARLQTNYIIYPISDLNVTFNSTSKVTCIGDIICGSMAYTTEHNGNRYYFGELVSTCYTKTFCGYNVNSFEYDHYAGKDDIFPLFVFNEYATTAYNDELYNWETAITAVNNTDDDCNMNSSNVFITTPGPTTVTTQTGNGSFFAYLYCGDTVTGYTVSEYDVKYYLFTVFNDSSVSFDACLSDYDTYLYFFDYNGTVLTECDDCGSCAIPSRSRLNVSPVYSGYYFLGIGGYSTDFGAYHIQVNCAEFIDPPNSNTTAESVHCGASFGGHTTANEPMANYSFILNAPVNNGLFVTFSLCGSDYDTYLQLFDNHSNHLYANDDSNQCGTASILKTDVLYNGDYKLRIGGYNGAFGNFMMNITCTNGTNDTAAPVINCGDSISGDTTSDAQFANYLFTVAEAGNNGLSVTFFSCGSDYDTTLWLFDNDSNYLATNDGSDLCGVASILTMDILYNSDYQLSIGGYEGAFGHFLLNATCDNVTSAAQPVYCGDSVGGNTTSAEKIANYSFIIDEVGNNGLYVTFSLCGSDYDTYLRLFDNDSNPLYANDDSNACGTASVLTTDILYNGDYKLSISGYNGAFGNFVMNIVCHNDSITTTMDASTTGLPTTGTPTTATPTTGMPTTTTSTDTFSSTMSSSANPTDVVVTSIDTTLGSEGNVGTAATAVQIINRHHHNIIFIVMIMWAINVS